MLYQKIRRATMLTISANYSIMIFAGAASGVIAILHKVNVKKIVMRNELLNVQIMQLLCEERAAKEQWE